MIDDKVCHIPLPLLMFTYTALRHALLQRQKNKGVPPKASMSKMEANRPDPSNNSNYKNDGGKDASCCAATGRKLLTSPGVADTYTFLMNTSNTLLESYQQRVYKNTLATVKRQIQQAENPTPAKVISTGAARVDSAILLHYLTSEVAFEEREIGSTDPNIQIGNNCTDDEPHSMMPGGSDDYDDTGDEIDESNAIATPSKLRRAATELERLDLGTSAVDVYDGDNGDNADGAEEEEASQADDGSTQNLEDCISKKHFRPGGMAPSERTRSVRAVRDTPVADYSAPGVNTTCHVAYLPLIAVSPFLLALSVSYCKHTLWRCGQLWPYVGMGSLGTRLHRDRNAMGDAATISPRVLGKRWEDIILPGCEDPRNCVDTRNLGRSKWDQKLGKIECEFSLYDKRRWKWDDVYVLRGLPNIYSPSLCPPPLPLDLCTTAVAPWRWIWSSVFEMHLETEIEWTQRCTWRPWLSKLGYALGDWDRVNSEMHLEARIQRVWRCTWRPWSSEFGDMHFEAMIVWTWRP